MKDKRDRENQKLDAQDLDLKSLGVTGEDGIKVKIVEESPFLSKLSNFWYYHKWKVIIISFFAIVFIVGGYQMLTKDDGDESIVIAGALDFDNEEMMEVEKILTSLKPNNKDGSVKKIDIYTYPIYSEEEFKAANESETDEEGKFIPKVLNSYNVDQIEEYDRFISTGECSILIVSRYLYERQLEYGRVLPLSEIFGENMPKGALSDGFGVRLGDTDLYDCYEELQVLDDDMVICILRSFYMGASSNKDKYDESKELFKRIVTFTYGGRDENESESASESDTEAETETK